MPSTNLLFKIYQSLIFKLPPEVAHSLTLNVAEYIYKSFLKKIISTERVNSQTKIMGINFPNKLGLAAGFDKNGEYLNFISNIGFGFIEIGTVTPKPQYGNEKPRIFRAIKDKAIVNNLGFNNKGVNYLKDRLKSFDKNQPIGINIGKNSQTKIERAHEDYEYCMSMIYPFADYITLNISSPNTEKLRELQSEKYFDNFLKRIKLMHDKLSTKYKKYVPLVIKISPDMTHHEVLVLCNLIKLYSIDGIIATNTTVDKKVLSNDDFLDNKGGVSGNPLLEKANTLNIPIYDRQYVSDLFVKDNICFGAMSFDISTGERTAHFSDAVILCTGGHTRAWKNSSSRRSYRWENKSIIRFNFSYLIMSHLGHNDFLEYWFEQGLSQGMTEDEAANYADEQAETRYI